MFAALAVVVTVTMLVACLMQLSQTMTRQQVVSVDNKRAFYIAEAGLSEALFGLHLQKSGSVGSSDIPAKFGDGLFWVEAEDQGSGKVKLDSVGLAGTGRFALSVMVERTSAKVGSLGIFAVSGLSIDRGTYIDGYNSILGNYAAQKAGGGGGGGLGGIGLGGLGKPPPEPAPMAKVGANVDVAITGTLDEPSIVEGDVTPGSAHSVLQSGVVTISGSTTPRDVPVELPPIEVPTDLPSLGDLAVAADTTVVMPSGQGAYDTIEVPARGRLEIHGPVRVAAGQLTVQTGGELHFDASSGPIELFVTERLWIQDGALMSAVETPSTQTSLLVPASEWTDRNGDMILDPPADLRAQGQYFGTIYAPNSPLTIVSGFEVFGGVVADSLTIESLAKLHFDFALTKDVGEALSEPTLLSWKIVELPKTAMVKHKHNPLDQLKQAGIVPPAAYQAHSASILHIAFLATDGKVYMWHGPDSNFDPVAMNLLVEIASYHDGEPKPLAWPIAAVPAMLK